MAPVSNPAVPSVLVLCTGNICRSPMAEALLQRELALLGLNAQVYSRGLAAPLGEPVHPHTRAVCAARGLPLAEDKRAAPVAAADFIHASLVLVMDNSHKHEVLRRAPSAGGKTWLLGQWEGREIADPIRQEFPAFELCWDHIEAGARSWALRLKETGLLCA